MRIVMVSDVHLEGPSPRQRAFIHWLDQLGADELYLVGDIFHHWWPFEHEVFDAYEDVCAALVRVRSRVPRIVFVPGNHDFRPGPFFTDTLGAEVRGAHAVTIEGRSFWIEHGDSVDTSHGYRLLSSVLRSDRFDLALQRLGRDAAWRMLRRLSGASLRRGTQSVALLEAQRISADARFTTGAEVVVMGHLHTPTDEVRAGGRFINLGDWVEHRTWLEVEGGRTKLRGI